MDVGSKYRQQLFDYTINKYGKECCALVSTFSLRKARGVIKDTARIFDVSIEQADTTAKLIPQVYYNDEDGEKQTDLSINEALDISKELVKVKDENEDWFKAAIGLENTTKTTSIHAAGTLISPIPLQEYIPLIRSKNDNMMATALDLKDAEYAGAIKYDYLGLATLDIINETEKDIGFKFDFNNEELLNDKSTWDLIGSRNTTTLFQISSKTYKQRMCRLKPRSILQLAACLALVRSPCISSKLDEQYMQIVEGRREIELIHPFYDSVTTETNGVLLYQEQLMQVLVNFGFSLERAFQIMKYASKKKQDKLIEAEEEYRLKANANNIPENITTRIWNIILDMGKYSFNKSHAISYALLCYVSAYYKTNYPIQWMRSALGNAYERKENITETIQECRRLGISFLGLDINESNWNFEIEDKKLRIGFIAVKGLGEIAFDTLNDVRKEHYFESLEDVTQCVSTKFNKKAFILSIFGGAFDFIENDRERFYKDYCSIREEEALETIKISKDMSFKTAGSLEEIETVIFETPIISNPIQYFEKFDFNEKRNGEKFVFQAIVRKVKKHKDKNENPMAFLTLETTSGHIDGVVFNSSYKGNTKYMKNNTIVNLEGKKSNDSIIIERFIA